VINHAKKDKGGEANEELVQTPARRSPAAE